MLLRSLRAKTYTDWKLADANWLPAVLDVLNLPLLQRASWTRRAETYYFDETISQACHPCHLRIMSRFGTDF